MNPESRQYADVMLEGGLLEALNYLMSNETDPGTLVCLLFVRVVLL